MIEPNHVTGRMVALIASVFVSLVAGTPYLYGVYAPQLVQRVGLSTSDAATISLAVNIGSGLGGLPAGLFIDRFGPQKAIWLGSACIFTGYFSLNRIYSYQVGSLPLVCLAMIFVGLGSVTSFFAGLKAAQANFPHHRGTAGALPVSAYGLAATLFSFIAAKFFNGKPDKLLAFLAYFCGSVAFVGSWFIHIYDPTPIDTDDVILFSDLEGSGLGSRVKRKLSLRGSFSFWGVGSRRLSTALLAPDQTPFITAKDHRTRNLMSMNSINLSLEFSSSADVSSSAIESNSMLLSPANPLLPTQDVEPKHEGPLDTIKSLVSDKTYLAHYCIVSLTSGMGQMYIYTVGFIVTAQFNYHQSADGSPSSLQAVQVSTISIAQFFARVVAGLLSDFLYKKLNAQRQWVIIGTIFLICIGQLLLVLTNSIHTITIISLFIGCGYGLLNGTYPAIIADKVGVKSFTTAWGLICSGPLVTLFTLNKYFGVIYDSQSNDAGQCFKGNDCYKGAFDLGIVLSAITLVGTLALIYARRGPSNPQ